MLVNETGRGEAVYKQVFDMLHDPDSLTSDLEPEIQDFVRLLVRHGRMEHAKLILNSFMRMYNESRNRKLAHLTTAVPMPGLEDRLKVYLEEKTGSEIIFESSVDPSIIGGFVLTVDDSMLDASVSRQIEELRRQFVEKNNRMV